jgi:DNA-directed RNA polymerase specialized sigma24 family protein
MSRDPVSAPLHRRLENWCNASRGAYDPVDAARITRAWQTLHPRHRDMLRMVYLWHASHEVICRRMRIPRRPAQRLELELAAARAALTHALESADKD